MTTADHSNTGIKWLSVFEGVATILIATAVAGIFGVLLMTQTMSNSLEQLMERFDRFEVRTDERLIKLETRVTRLETKVTKDD